MANSRRAFVGSALSATAVTLTNTLISFGQQSAASSNAKPDDSPAQPQKRDYWDKPFRVAVALGESTTAGGTATSRELTWVSLLAKLINESQLDPVKMINSGIGANVISRRSPEYENSGKPSAMERYEKHVVAHDPDLVLVSYGLNDARGGTPLAQFLQDVSRVVTDIKGRTGALTVIVNAYFRG